MNRKIPMGTLLDMTRRAPMRRTLWLATAAAVPLLLSACGGSSDSAAPVAQYACNDGLKAADLGNSLAKITNVKLIKAGDTYPTVMSGYDGFPASPTAKVEMCLVKMLVGPGNPGPADSRSTSTGIGIEVLLPTAANWNQRYVSAGSGGYAGGGGYVSATQMGYGTYEAQPVAELGYVVSASDDGHVGRDGEWFSGVDGSFGLKPDGSLNTTLLQDFAYRSLHETAVKTKALIKAYYGKAPAYSYFSGGSSGGREAMMVAQRYPTDFNGIISAYPAMNWTSFIPSMVWPHIVMQQDLGGPIADAKQEAVHLAAVAACDTGLTGQHDGYISDPATCRYDPTKDKAVLCVASGGTNSNAASCLTTTEAGAMNKIWYGSRLDGGMVDPAGDNGWNPQVLASGQLWFGYNRGTPLYPSPFAGGDFGVGGQVASAIGTSWLALTLENPAYGSAGVFANETGDGRDLWTTIGYTGPNSFASILLQSRAKFDTMIATDNPDLSAFKSAGGKLIHYHGTADAYIPAGGSTQYAERLRTRMGVASADEFYRYYLVPGLGHGVAGAELVPVPGGLTGSNSGYFSGINNTILPILRDWVEGSKAPDVLSAQSDASATPARTRPWCAYPKKLKYLGGDVNIAASFTCM